MFYIDTRHAEQKFKFWVNVRLRTRSQNRRSGGMLLLLYRMTIKSQNEKMAKRDLIFLLAPEIVDHLSVLPSNFMGNASRFR